MDESFLEQLEFDQVTNNKRYFSIIESLLFVSGEPLKLKDISSIIDCSKSYTKKLLNDMEKEYENIDRGIMLINLDEKYQLVTKEENDKYIQKILKTNIRQSLSQAAIETLSIIAYKQPVTRVDIDEIRGVKSEAAINTLLEKKMIKESGRLDIPGRPILYSVTEDFLRQFNISSLEDLPKLETFEEEKKE